MIKRENVPEFLYNVYAYRKNKWNINSSKDLETLLMGSEREFYFFMTYAYITNMDLSNLVNQDNTAIRVSLSVYAEQAKQLGLTDIIDYLQQFMQVNESNEQARVVLAEIQRAQEREKLDG